MLQLIILLPLLACEAQPEDPSKLTSKQLSQLMNAYHPTLRDVYLEYEGFRTTEVAEERQLLHTEEDGITHKFSGTYRFKNPEKYKVEIFETTLQTKSGPANILNKKTIACDGIEAQINQNSDHKGGRGTIRPASSGDLIESGSYGRISTNKLFTGLLDYDMQAMYYGGTETIDQFKTHIYTIVIGRPPFDKDGPSNVSYRFWVDLDKTGLILRQEVKRGSLLLSRLSDVRVEHDTNGFPFVMHARYENFGRNTQLLSVEEQNVLKETVRTNRGVSDRQLSIDFAVGTPISDVLKNATYEAGQDRRPPPETLKQAQARLDQGLKQAQNERGQLDKATWEREESFNWLYWTFLSLFVVAIVFFVGLFIKRR